MTINDFNKPTSHPFGMCAGYNDASEKENFLAWMLIQCIEAGNFGPVQTEHNHDSMLKQGLLSGSHEDGYTLTKKSIGLLYGYYGKEETA